MGLARSPPWRFLRSLWARRRQRRRLAALASAPHDPKKPTLLVIDHHFHNEIKALRRHAPLSETFQLLVVDSFDLFNKNLWYFPPSVWHAEEAYESPRFARARERSQQAAAQVLSSLRRSYNLVGLVTPSDSFYWLRGMIREARRQGLVTFVFDKEGTISPAGFQTDTVKIREHFPPVSDWYYVWSNRQRDFWLQAGARPEQIRVLGSLRTDLYVNMPPARETRVLLYDFDPSAYALMIPPEDRARMPEGWTPLKREIHAILIEAIRAHPDVPFTVKCHPQQTDVAQTQATFQGLPNVRVATGSRNVDELTAEHSIALGFQTTALLEVALTTRPAVYFGWGELHEALRHHLVPLMEPGFGIHQADRPEKLRQLIEDHIAGKRLTRPSIERLKTFFHQPDGHVAQRYYEAMLGDLKVPGPKVRASSHP